MLALSRTPAALLVAASLAFACTTREAASPETGAARDTSEVVAVIGGRSITMNELDGWLKDDLFKQQTESKNAASVFEFRSDGLERMITERLVEAEAQKQGMTADELLKLETSKSVAVDDQAVQKFYDDNKARMGGQSFEQIAPRIRQHLEQQAKQDSWTRYLDGLRQSEKVEIKLEQPRVQVAADGASRGPADAPITIIEFSDYQCPFCRKAEPTVKEVLARYGDKVRFVYRHFPLDMHPRARPAAEAAECAGLQNKFWEFHEKVFTTGKLEDTDLTAHATEVGLDMGAYQQCLAEGKTKARVSADFEAGRAAGVTGTPAFFINGLMLSGAQPVDAFVQKIERELQTAKSGGATQGG
jgi:protein-disulfide isomerase